MEPTYTIVRFYQTGVPASEVLARGLSLREAQDHCQNPETSSSTCTLPEAVQRTNERGPWFDGYRLEA